MLRSTNSPPILHQACTKQDIIDRTEMDEIVNTEFPELAQTGLDYLSWSSDCEIWFEGKGLLRVIGKGTLLAPH
ncbi:Splicing factor 3B subunit 1 [Hordeum vulgare]|nr:Splicing factor 3B subunit 1 [Hordeum vulgare]